MDKPFIWKYVPRMQISYEYSLSQSTYCHHFPTLHTKIPGERNWIGKALVIIDLMYTDKGDLNIRFIV